MEYNLKHEYIIASNHSNTTKKTVIESKICKTVSQEIIFILIVLVFFNYFSQCECQLRDREGQYLNINSLKLNNKQSISFQYLNSNRKNLHISKNKVLRNTHNHKATEESIENGKIEDALIEAFKLKLLQLLDVDQVPKSGQLNMSRTSIPEPIMREYNRLLKLSHSERNRIKENTLELVNSNQRSLRERPYHGSLYNVDDETVRFNSSIVQQITLLPKKVKFMDASGFYLNEENWCSDWKNENKFNNKNIKGKNFRHLTTLNCFLFSIDQKEFYLNEIKSSFLYFKLNLDLLKNEIVYLINKNLRENSNIDISSHLYIEINGESVKKIDLKVMKRYDSNLESDEDENNLYFDFADVKKVLEKTLYTKPLSSNEANKSCLLRVRLLCTNDLVNLTQSKNGLRQLFSKVDENIALHVKFGEPLAQSKFINRNKRHNGNNKGKSPKPRNFRDCAELRKAGYSSNNLTCCRETITFSMEQIGWSHWIYSPRVIEYKYCRGGCYTGLSPRFDNTQIIFKLFEENKSMLSAHCCNIYEYEEDIPFIYGSPPNYLTKMISLNAKSCLCS